MTLAQYRLELEHRLRLLTEMPAVWPRGERYGRMGELENALAMLARVEAAAAVPATGHPDPEFATRKDRPTYQERVACDRRPEGCDHAL